MFHHIRYWKRTMADILIIDDDPIICDLLVQLMEKINHQSCFALTGAQGLELARSGGFDLVFLDVKLPDGNGLDLIETLKRLPSRPEIIIITGESDPDGAELAITSGAWNYLEKPFFRQEINLQVKRALQFRKEKGRVPNTGGLRRNDLIGESYLLGQCLDQVKAAAYSKTPVLITGEAGTGKELFARTIHLNSDFSENNFVILDCSAINGDSAERMLHGPRGQDHKQVHKKGGLLGLAHGGTLLVDDVDQLPLNIQESLFRTMQNHTYHPMGAQNGEKSCFRVIATTRQDLEKRVEVGAFNQDLFLSLTGQHIQLPVLKDMPGDIIPIAIHYMDRYCRKYRVEPKGISPECLDIIQAYHWPGNIRELINAVGKAVASAKHEPTIYSIHLPSQIKADVIGKSAEVLEKDRASVDTVFQKGSLKTFLEDREREYLTQLYQDMNKDVQKACKIAGISKSAFYARLRKYQIT